MAYITANEVKAIRDELKVVFGKKFKFSVRKCSGGYSVTVTILKGKVDFSDLYDEITNRYPNEAKFDGYGQINPYHTYNYGKHKSLFDKIIGIIKTAPAKAGGRAWYDNSDAMTDYFDTAYYYNLNIGAWNKPYEKV